MFYRKTNYNPFHLNCRKATLFLGKQKPHRRDTAAWHQNSVQHDICVRALTARESKTIPRIKAILNDMEVGLDTAMDNLMQAAFYVAKREKPMEDYPALVDLLHRTGAKVPGCYASPKACARYDA